MTYIKNNYYPSWIPEEYRKSIDLSELATPNSQIESSIDSLTEELGFNFAAYKVQPVAKVNGLCSIFKAATLNTSQIKHIKRIEKSLRDVVLVAYTNPLEI